VNREPCTVLVTRTATANTILSKIDRFLEAKAMNFCPRAVVVVVVVVASSRFV